MYYKFTDDCLIGVDQIDDEHRELFRLVGEVQDLLHDKWTDDKFFEICDVVDRLKNYAAEHFRHEEEYMEQIGHPELALQREQHAQFCEKVNEVDLRSAEGDQQAFIEDILSFLVKWLYRHIMGSDVLIGKLMSVEEWKQRGDFTFEDEYLTGIESIDEEHKGLVKILDELHYLVSHDDSDDAHDKILNLLKYFRNCIQVHFRNEEEYMESIRYEELEVQKLAHDVFIARLELMDLDEFDMFDASKRSELDEHVAALTEWVVAHIIHMDKNIGKI